MSYLFFLQIVIFSILLFAFPKKYMHVIIIFFSFLLGINVFSWDPSVEMDLYRNFTEIETYRRIDFNIFDDILFVKSIIFYFISLTPYNGLLPAFAAFIVYYLNLKLIYDISNQYCINKKDTILVILFMLATINYLTTVSGIRTGIVIAVFNYFLYKELVENKYITLSWIMYFLMIFLHPLVVLMVIFRCMLFIKNKVITLLLVLLFLITAFFSNQIIENIIVTFNFSNDFLIMIFSKVIAYAEFSESDSNFLTFVFLLFKFGGLLFIYFCFMVIFASKYNEVKNITKYFFMMISCLFIFANNYFIQGNYVIFARYLLAINGVSCLFLLLILKNLNKNFYSIAFKGIIVCYILANFYYYLFRIYIYF